MVPRPSTLQYVQFDLEEVLRRSTNLPFSRIIFPSTQKGETEVVNCTLCNGLLQDMSSHLIQILEHLNIAKTCTQS